MPKRAPEPDVAIVGAGLAGLAAARSLERRGLRVVVVEAAEEVGGRTRSSRRGPGVGDLGGEWVGSRNAHMVALTRALGLRLEPTGFLGAPLMWRANGAARVARLPAPRMAVPLVRTQLKLDRLAAGLTPEAPWTAERADELDAYSYADWLREEGVGGAAYDYLTKLVGALSSTRAQEISLLQICWWAARTGSAFATLSSTVKWRVAGGAALICRRIADQLRGEVVLGQPIAAIGQDGDSVRLTAEGGREVAARRAIVTAPLGTSPSISYDPGLPEGLARVEAELKMEPAIKLTATLPPGHGARQKLAIGGSPVSAAWRYGDRVVGFVSPWEATAADESILADLAAAFGVGPHELRDPEILRWSERAYIPGGDLGFRPGQLTSLAPLLEGSHGRVAFAGAERSSWPNNMEGAVMSGQRVAAATAAQLAV